MESSNTQIRRALRAYHCHACDQDFKEMVNLNDLSSVKCPNCQSDFFEEKKSFEEAKAEPQPAPQMQQPQPQPQPQMPRMQQQQMHMGAAAQSMGQPPQMRRQQTVTLTQSPRGGWTQSITVSYGPGSSGPQIHQQHHMQGSMNMMPPRQQEFAHAHAQQQHQHHEDPMADFFGRTHGPSMVDPFQQMEQMMGNANDMFGHPMFAQPQQQQARPDSPPRMFQMFGGGHPRMGHVFFQNGFPMQEQNNAQQGCSEDFISNLPEKEAGKESDCYICLDKCKEGKDSCQLPCNHAFDRDCLTHWLKDHDSCPVCRVKLDTNRPRSPQQQQPQAHQHPGNVFFF